MKRAICLTLLLLLLCSLWGCRLESRRDTSEPVEFFYPRKSGSFVYGAPDGVIGSELRDISGHMGDLNYLLSVYLRGPLDSELRSPFPAGCRLVKAEANDDTLYIVLSAEFTALENLELTLACASLAETGLTLGSFHQICIEAASSEKTFIITLNADDLLLADQSASAATSPAEQSQ